MRSRFPTSPDRRCCPQAAAVWPSSFHRPKRPETVTAPAVFLDRPREMPPVSPTGSCPASPQKGSGRQFAAQQESVCDRASRPPFRVSLEIFGFRVQCSGTSWGRHLTIYTDVDMHRKNHTPAVAEHGDRPLMYLLPNRFLIGHLKMLGNLPADG